MKLKRKLSIKFKKKKTPNQPKEKSHERGKLKPFLIHQTKNTKIPRVKFKKELKVIKKNKHSRISLLYLGRI